MGKVFKDGLIMKRQVGMHSRSRCKKITKDIYHYFYLHAKGNIYKNKSVLVEAIHKMKQEKIRENQLAEQQEARRVKAAAKKQQRNHRKQVSMGIIAEEEGKSS